MKQESEKYRRENIHLLKLRAIIGTVMNRCSREERLGLAEINLILAKMMNSNQMHIKD